MTALADAAMRHNAAVLAEVPPATDFTTLTAGLKDVTTRFMIGAIRAGDPTVTVDDLACALDGIDSFRRAREFELTDTFLNGSHWPGDPSCPGCAA